MWWLPRLWSQAKLGLLAVLAAMLGFFSGYAAMFPELAKSPSSAVVYGLFLNGALWYCGCLLRDLTLFSGDAVLTYTAPLSMRQLLFRTIRLRWPLHLGGFVLVPGALFFGGWVAKAEMPPSTQAWGPLAIVNAAFLYFAILVAPFSEALIGSRSPLAVFFVGKYLGWLKRRYWLGLLIGVGALLWYTDGAAYTYLETAIERLLELGDLGVAVLTAVSPASAVLAAHAGPAPLVLASLWLLVLFFEAWAIVKTLSPSQQANETRAFEHWLDYREQWTEAAVAQADAEETMETENSRLVATATSDGDAGELGSDDRPYDGRASAEKLVLRQLAALRDLKKKSFRDSPRIAYNQIMKIFAAVIVMIWAGWFACRGWTPKAVLFGDATFCIGMLRSFCSGGWWRNSIRVSLALPMRMKLFVLRTAGIHWAFNVAMDVAAASLAVAARELPPFCVAVFFVAYQLLGCSSHLNTWIAAMRRSGYRVGQFWLGAQGLLVIPGYLFVIRHGDLERWNLLSDWRTWASISLLPLAIFGGDTLLLLLFHRRADTCVLRTT